MANSVFWGLASIFGVPTFVRIDADGPIVNRSTGAPILGIDPRTVRFETMRRAGRRIALSSGLNVRHGTVAASAMKIATWRYTGVADLFANATVPQSIAADAEHPVNLDDVLANVYAFYGVNATEAAA